MNTETISPRYRDLDAWSDAEILDAFWEGQARAIAAVRPALPAIAAAVQAIADRIEPDGRLIYAGAGSSGQQAALDGMELRATFGWPTERVVYLLAERRLSASGLAGANEDDATRARISVKELQLNAPDVMIAVAASGTTPFTLATAAAARQAGALVVAVANNADASLFNHADHRILLDTGAEVIAGSTRMNAGTAQKAALGLLSSLLMTRLGRVHGGLMVNMPVDRSKMSKRAIRIVAAIAGCDEERASEALKNCSGSIKQAVLVAKGIDPAAAEHMIAEAGGSLRRALGMLADEVNRAAAN